jgi:hypothetical protein
MVTVLNGDQGGGTLLEEPCTISNFKASLRLEKTQSFALVLKFQSFAPVSKCSFSTFSPLDAVLKMMELC